MIAPDQLTIGTEHELEHTTDWRIAQQIAMDHLREDPDYYRKLARCGLGGTMGSIDVPTDEAVDYYLRAAIWTMSDDDRQMYGDDFAPSHFTAESINQARTELGEFLLQVKAALEGPGGDALQTELAVVSVDGVFTPPFTEQDLAYDFWLTRNRHGVGFWDRPEKYGETFRKVLTDIAHRFSERTVVRVELEGQDGPVSLEIV